VLGSTKEGGYRASNKKVSISIGHKIKKEKAAITGKQIEL